MRLWSWRDEYGSERHHARALGADILALGDSWVWETLTNPLHSSLPPTEEKVSRQ
jgi:hypothetical protein